MNTPDNVPYRRFAAPPVGSVSVRCELLPAVLARRQDDEPLRPTPRPVRVGDWVRINKADERAGQPDGEVVSVDAFPPGRSIGVKPPGGVQWYRWENEVHHVPRG